MWLDHIFSKIHFLGILIYMTTNIEKKFVYIPGVRATLY